MKNSPNSLTTKEARRQAYQPAEQDIHTKGTDVQRSKTKFPIGRRAELASIVDLDMFQKGYDENGLPIEQTVAVEKVGDTESSDHQVDDFDNLIGALDLEGSSGVLVINGALAAVQKNRVNAELAYQGSPLDAEPFEYPEILQTVHFTDHPN
jgi:hypothetical protein